jgi:hypothetical protein
LTEVFHNHISQLAMVKRKGRADGPDFNILALDDQVHPQPPPPQSAFHPMAGDPMPAKVRLISDLLFSSVHCLLS